MHITQWLCTIWFKQFIVCLILLTNFLFIFAFIFMPLHEVDLFFLLLLSSYLVKLFFIHLWQKKFFVCFAHSELSSCSSGRINVFYFIFLFYFVPHHQTRYQLWVSQRDSSLDIECHNWVVSQITGHKEEQRKFYRFRQIAFLCAAQCFNKVLYFFLFLVVIP